MGSEAAPVLFGIPLVGCLVVLLILALTERKYSDRSERLLGLGRARLARGYLGALGALLMICILLASPERRVEMAVFYLFPLFGILLVIFLTLLFLPILALLRRYGFASASGVVGTAVGIAGSIGLAFDGALFPSMLGGVTLAVAFSVAANLPLVRSNAV